MSAISTGQLLSLLTQDDLAQFSTQPHNVYTPLNPAEVRFGHAPHTKLPSSLYLECQPDSALLSCWLSASHLLQEAFLDVPSCHVIPGEPILKPGLTMELRCPSDGDKMTLYVSSVALCIWRLTLARKLHRVRWARNVRSSPFFWGQAW